jgi:UDP-N-acetylmuramate dehydrogenase
MSELGEGASYANIDLQENVSLQSHSGMATPAQARYLALAQSINELVAAIEFAAHKNLPWLLIGAGSNTVFTKDYGGVVIVNRVTGIERVAESDEHVTLRVAAGENWHQLVTYCINEGLHGVENLALIPGTVGAAPIQNIGAYGVEIESCIETVEYYHSQTKTFEVLTRDQCRFAYRDSIFKHELSGVAVVTYVNLSLNKHSSINISYKALADYLGNRSVTALDVYHAVCDIRQQKLPLPSVIPNCGSFFKNPLVTEDEYLTIFAQYPNVVSYVVEGGRKLAAGWLIERAGWKEKSLAGVKVFAKQALVIINPKRAEGRQVAEFAMQIQQDIKQRFGIRLEIEPVMI